MQRNIYTRPNNKPRRMLAPAAREIAAAPKPPPAPVVVPKGTECFVTPPAVCLRMAQLYLEHEAGQSVLEPSAGTGNMVQALLDTGTILPLITAIEIEPTLCNVLRERFPRLAVEEGCFLREAEITARTFDRVLMNPPFSGARKHVEAAQRLLRPGGVIVALVPVTFKHPEAITLEKLPNDTFSAAKVWSKIIRIERDD